MFSTAAEKNANMLTKKLTKLIFIYRDIHVLVGFGVPFFSNKLLLPFFLGFDFFGWFVVLFCFVLFCFVLWGLLVLVIFSFRVCFWF